ncbi:MULTISPECIES: peptidoglycan D,D-transpeptidase FtsI family protein [Chromobacterium]|uniref:Peptidoglycan D,D-transpeptidase FtsI n=2 Tax=Chromobacterium TaxID=535 RepID=A0ABS3GM53_9NEIS|nr:MULTISPECIES: penicillin-binding transpeptidase domain-containing protein [Chromobacterium]AXT44907.1 penicillin-binding protein 2 [Chromobacterium rhizoryzae]MBK0414735.1 penicillin-binding protein 2 [Chromobacterium haemolyticum]MBO0416114.1 penicillin-binding protein 2 [Chromobacterium haemolyticum]MBO0499387.1 penicillin-binding protein 2 [Chromobacterium haemolyticum]MDH0342549.1 penicillin-binding transpeptidase domain-containing protein [Chromobacterium haemolyticum]
MRTYSPRHQQRIPDASPALRMKPGRVRFVLLMLALLFLALIGRAVYLQVMQQDFLQNQGEARFRRALTLEANRGVITDRNGEPLAISSPVQTIWASPADMEPVPPAKLRELAAMLDLSPEELSAKLSDRKKEFVYIKRQISPELADKVMALGVPGIAKQQEFRRFYPAGEIVSHIIGFTGVDGKGQEGVELAREKMLAGKDGRRVVLKDRRGHIIEDVAAIEPPRDGQKLALAVDHRIQYLAYRELKAAVELNKAKAGSVVVLDAHTGELLALANYPSFNPNNRSGVTPEMMRNRGVIDLFEPGSTMKPLSIALALENGKAGLNTVLDTHTYMIGPATIRDVAPRPSLDILGIIQKSSNVGTSKLALMSSPEQTWKHYDALGFGRAPETGFPGEAGGRLRDWHNWRPIEQATMSFGYGISVSLIQMARAYTVFANDGVMLPISLYKTNTPMPGKRVLAEKTAHEMRDLLIANSQPGGGAVGGRIIGYSIGGKSGTARKLEGRTYVANKHRALFMGFAPGKSPRVIVSVMIDEPSAGKYYGGAVAAPVFSQIAGGALRVLNVQPDEPSNNTLLPESTPVPVDF